MIEVNTKIHDRFSIEFKMGFLTRRKLRENNFSVYMWLFIPNSLDINPSTYPKSRFYQDIKSNIRLVTPQFLLREIAGGDAVPLNNLRDAFEALAKNPTRTLIAEYEYQIKMFAAITKSSLREEYNHICSGGRLDGDTDYLCRGYVENVRNILSSYRDLWKIINVPSVSPEVREYFFFGDDFISSMVKGHSLKIYGELSRRESGVERLTLEQLKGLIEEEMAYREHSGYGNLSLDNPKRNRDIIFRHGVLKKYIESDLFLKVPKKKDGILVEQLYFSIAAGMSMIFATIVSFSFQKTFGNFTLPLFIALVVSYMMKDRIKELMRYYFAHRIGSRYFDNKASIIIKGKKIGLIKEGVDFISEEKIPSEVRSVRYGKRLLDVENRISDEKVLLYRKSVRIDREQLEANNIYETRGINDIVRLHINSFLQKMDDPRIYVPELSPEGKQERILCDKVYYINIVLQLCTGQEGGGKGGSQEMQSEYRRFRVALTRDGIDSIEQVE